MQPYRIVILTGFSLKKDFIDEMFQRVAKQNTCYWNASNWSHFFGMHIIYLRINTCYCNIKATEIPNICQEIPLRWPEYIIWCSFNAIFINRTLLFYFYPVLGRSVVADYFEFLLRLVQPVHICKRKKLLFSQCCWLNVATRCRH